MWVFDGEEWESDATEQDLSRRKAAAPQVRDRFQPELQPELQIVEIVPHRPRVTPSKQPANQIVPGEQTH